jgi:hypothetical protein
MSKSDVLFEAMDNISDVSTSSKSVVYLNVYVCNE